MTKKPLPVVFGCAGTELTAGECEFFRVRDPLGFILFGRNIVDPAQVKKLTKALRDTVGRADAPVLIDQEGGRVARLRPPHWRASPAAGKIGALAGEFGLDLACEAAHLNSLLIAAELIELGIDVDCAPVADVPAKGAHDIIGDRAYATDAFVVGKVARAAAQGLVEGGVLPVVKHLPGHGRARSDSHEELPVVEDRRSALEGSDFAAFRALADMPWAMTAHVMYTCLDDERPATVSPRIISDIVRGHIGFKGVLISDDLSMKALEGDLASRARASIDAGCDLALHCTGVLSEMEEIAGALPAMTAACAERISRGRSRVAAPVSFDRVVTKARLSELMGALA